MIYSFLIAVNDLVCGHVLKGKVSLRCSMFGADVVNGSILPFIIHCVLLDLIMAILPLGRIWRSSTKATFTI